MRSVEGRCLPHFAIAQYNHRPWLSSLLFHQWEQCILLYQIEYDGLFLARFVYLCRRRGLRRGYNILIINQGLRLADLGELILNLYVCMMFVCLHLKYLRH